jgi:hypothetical protein
MEYNDVMKELESASNPKSKKDYQNHGADGNIYGVSVADLRRISKKTGPNHELSLKLYYSGHFDAMHLSPMVADPGKLTEDILDDMASKAYCHVLADYAVASLAAEQEATLAAKLANKWILSENEMIKSTGWNTYAMLICIHEDVLLSKAEILSRIYYIKEHISYESDLIKNAMVKFIIAAGKTYTPLHGEALAAAVQIGKVKVSLSPAGGKTWDPASEIQNTAKKGLLGKKKKSFR